MGALLDEVFEASENGDGNRTIQFDSSLNREATLQSSDMKEWKYEISEDGSNKKYSGTITISEANISEIDLDNLTNLNLSINGSLPKSEFEKKLSQDIDMSVELKKDSDDIVSLTIKKIEIKDSVTSLILSQFHSSAAYENENGSDNKTSLKFVKFDKVFLEGKSGDFTIKGDLQIPEYKENSSIDSDFTNSGWVPSILAFNGDIKDSKTKNEIIGKLRIKWLNAQDMDISKNSQEQPEADIAFEGTIKRDNHPDMVLKLNMNNQNKNTIKLSYSVKQSVLSIESIFDKEGKNGSVKFSSPEGIKITIPVKDGQIVYNPKPEVTKNGRLVGTLEERRGVPVIKYLDGTFESLP
jgi:hypothetical protein